MHSFINKRGFGIALSLTLALSLLPTPSLAAQTDGLCPHHSAHTTECGFFTEGSSCSFALNGCDDCRESLIPIIGTDVLIDGTSFPFTGQEIRPQITVTVADQKLTEGEHYSLTYENNIQPGEAAVTVTGLAEGGYQGIVTIAFTITPAAQPEDTQKPGESEKPGDTETQDPTEDTQPEETQPEETQPEETKPVEYKITKGSGSTWYQGSGKNLSFTANGKREDLKDVRINGKTLDKASYSVADGTVVTLNKSYLNKLTVGKYTVTIRFADGQAEGTFSVSNKLDTTNPTTGDESGIGLWVLTGAASLAALGGAALITTRKKKQ